MKLTNLFSRINEKRAELAINFRKFHPLEACAGVQILVNPLFHRMSSFCFHCDFCNKKSQKPLWVLGFRRRHLFRSAILAGAQGFEPRKCQSQSLMPYRLATPQYFQHSILYHTKIALSIPILNIF